MPGVGSTEREGLLREGTSMAANPGTHTVSGDEVLLVLPAAPEYVRLARMTAAGLASRLGFSYDDIEDLRIAVDELCYVLVGPTGRGGTIALTYCLTADALVIDGIMRIADGGEGRYERNVPNELSEQIVAAVVDDYTLALDSAAPRFTLRKKASGLR